MAAGEEATSPKGVARGIAWMVLTTFMFVAVTGIVRYLGTAMPAVEAAFIRYAFGLLLVLPLVLRVKAMWPPKKRMKLFVLRGLVHGCAVMLWFFAMARIPIAEVTAIGYLSPIFVTIGAAVFLGERLQIRRIFAVLIGFAGTLIILRPGFQTIEIGSLAQLAAAPLFAISFIITKLLTRDEDPSVIVFMLSLFCTATLLPGAVMQWRAPTLEELSWLGLVAVFATTGHYTLTKAFAAAPISVTQPVGFLQLVWAALLGMVAFGEPLDPYLFAGAAVIIAAATYIAHREARLARVAYEAKKTAAQV